MSLSSSSVHNFFISPFTTFFFLVALKRFFHENGRSFLGFFSEEGTYIYVSEGELMFHGSIILNNLWPGGRKAAI